MNQYYNPKKSDWKSLVTRPYIDNGSIYETVIDVFKTVKEYGDVSLRELTKKFDKVELASWAILANTIINLDSFYMIR